MGEEIKEAIEILETLSCYGLSLKITDENIQAIDIVLDYIEKLQKENEEKTTILMAGADKVKQLEKENENLKRQLKAEIYGRDMIVSLNSNIRKENKELKEELDYYKQKESQDFDERDYDEE